MRLKNTFQLTHSELTFLGLPASDWGSDGNYQSLMKLVNGFSPVNDAAKWAVKFSSDLNGRITGNAEKHASMLQGV